MTKYLKVSTSLVEVQSAEGDHHVMKILPLKLIILRAGLAVRLYLRLASELDSNA